MILGGECIYANIEKSIHLGLAKGPVPKKYSVHGMYSSGHKYPTPHIFRNQVIIPIKNFQN